MLHIKHSIAIAVVVAIVLTGCVDTAETTPFVESNGSVTEPLTSQIEMTIKDFHHHPNQIIANQGSVLHVTNLDDAGQSVLSDDKSLDTGILGQNESADLKLSELGKFTFSSEPYPNMTGTITVVQ